MSDSYTVTSNQSWFSRLVGSIVGVIIGLVLFVASFPLLWWNEGRAVQTERSLKEGAGSIVSTPVDTIDPAKEGKLVHLSGPVATDKPVVDDELAVQTTAVKLLRGVEMYQWTESKKSETRKKIGGGEETVTTYSYAKDWAEGYVDSTNFQRPEGHENPDPPPFETKTFVAETVKVGAHKLSPAQVEKLDDEVPFPLEPAAREQLSAELQEKFKVADGSFYAGENPKKPALGDFRVTYRAVKPETVSLAAAQTGDSFSPYAAKAGDQILLVQTGVHTAAEMFKLAQAANTVITWALRAVGWFLMFLGIALVFRPFVIFADVLPFLGTMLGAGIGAFAFLVSAAFSFVTIAIAWVFVRPFLGISMLVIGVGAIVWLIRVGRRKRDARAAGTLPPLRPSPSPAT